MFVYTLQLIYADETSCLCSQTVYSPVNNKFNDLKQFGRSSASSALNIVAIIFCIQFVLLGCPSSIRHVHCEDNIIQVWFKQRIYA